MKVFLIFLFLLPHCLSAQTDSISSILQSRINHSGKQKVHSVLFYMDKEEEGFIFYEGFGLTQENGEKVSKDAQFKIASITKPFVATIILQLMEEGKIQLEDKASKYLKDIDFLHFKNLHFYNNENHSEAITIEQLLSHRSGLADIFNDKGDQFLTEVFHNPQKQYSPETIVKKYYQYELNKQAHFKPGDDFFYSDMNYVLLGLLIQEIDKVPLAEAIRTRILERLNMKNTYLQFYELALGDLQQVHQYIEETDMTEVNTSFDWAGGGLVSTSTDLAIFIKALFENQLINKASLQKMVAMKVTKKNHNRYGLGLYESEYNGDVFYGHYGFFGTYLGYCPQKKITIAYNISQQNPGFNVTELVNEVLKISSIGKP